MTIDLIFNQPFPEQKLFSVCLQYFDSIFMNAVMSVADRIGPAGNECIQTLHGNVEEEPWRGGRAQIIPVCRYGPMDPAGFTGKQVFLGLETHMMGGMSRGKDRGDEFVMEFV